MLLYLKLFNILLSRGEFFSEYLALKEVDAPYMRDYLEVKYWDCSSASILELSVGLYGAV